MKGSTSELSVRVPGEPLPPRDDLLGSIRAHLSRDHATALAAHAAPEDMEFPTRILGDACTYFNELYAPDALGRWLPEKGSHWSSAFASRLRNGGLQVSRGVSGPNQDRRVVALAIDMAYRSALLAGAAPPLQRGQPPWSEELITALQPRTQAWIHAIGSLSDEGGAAATEPQNAVAHQQLGMFEDLLHKGLPQVARSASMSALLQPRDQDQLEMRLEQLIFVIFQFARSGLTVPAPGRPADGWLWNRLDRAITSTIENPLVTACVIEGLDSLQRRARLSPRIDRPLRDLVGESLRIAGRRVDDAFRDRIRKTQATRSRAQHATSPGAAASLVPALL